VNYDNNEVILLVRVKGLCARLVYKIRKRTCKPAFEQGETLARVPFRSARGGVCIAGWQILDGELGFAQDLLRALFRNMILSIYEGLFYSPTIRELEIREEPKLASPVFSDR
jgi:hypothetical protein